MTAQSEVENIKRLINEIHGLTSSTDFEVSNELYELMNKLWIESDKVLSGDIITAINSVEGAYVLVRIISILSGRRASSEREEQFLQLTCICVYNFSDGREFAKNAANTCIVKKCMENLRAQENLLHTDSLMIDGCALRVIEFSLGIIYNITKEDIGGLFDDDLPILHNYKNARKEDFSAMSVMILAHLSESKAEKIHDEKETTAYLITLLRKAMKHEHRRAVGFSSTELIEGLGRLALNDNNKLTILEKDGVSLLVSLIRSQGEIKDQIAAAQCLWTLAFLPSIQKKLQKLRGEFKALSVSCDNTVLRKTLQGLLLTLQTPNATTKARQFRGKHIMVSYAWDGGYGQNAARKIASHLKSRGMNVWIDTDEMKGSFLDAMAMAVNDCYAFVLCVSEKYRKSNNCRLEASSAHIQDKLIIPVVVESSIHSKRDWLALLCADKLYIDFTIEAEFHQKCEELVQQIVSLSHVADETDVIVPESVAETKSAPKTGKSVEEWSPHDVKTWLRDCAIQCFEEEFEGFDGSALVRLKRVHYDAPEFFYRYFCESKDGKGGKRLFDVIKLIEAIESL